jgi:RNA polymerase sigma-70 factor (ECF subfamily)
MDLLERFACGELEAFETIVHQSQGEIYSWLVRLVGNRGVAEDLTIETLWRIYQARHRFRIDGNFNAWARRIASNLAIDHLRRNRREETVPEELAAPDWRDHLVQKDKRRKIQEAFYRLPAKLQVTATLALVEEHSYKEIADILGISVAAVKLRVFRAVRILRRQLAQLGIRPE